jgi:hypothetical protein
MLICGGIYQPAYGDYMPGKTRRAGGDFINN